MLSTATWPISDIEPELGPCLPPPKDCASVTSLEAYDIRSDVVNSSSSSIREDVIFCPKYELLHPDCFLHSKLLCTLE